MGSVEVPSQSEVYVLEVRLRSRTKESSGEEARAAAAATVRGWAPSCAVTAML